MVGSDGVFGFEIWDANGKSVALHGDFDVLPEAFRVRVTENFTEDGYRNIYRKDGIGSVRIVAEADAELFQGSRAVKRACAVYLTLVPRFKQIETSHRQRFDAIVRRFAHNLVKFQTRFKGNFSRLVPDEVRSRPFAELKEKVKARIENNTAAAAADVCQLSHRAVDLDAQIDTLRIISGYADHTTATSRIRVDLVRAVYRIINPFFEELQERRVRINVNISPAASGAEKVTIDPILFNATIWQLMDNASKYVKDNTTIDITANLSLSPKTLEFTMTSVCIDADETETIFFEGTKGRHAGKKGENGIGLFIVKKALGLMSATISVGNEGYVCMDGGYNYCVHRFTISFNE